MSPQAPCRSPVRRDAVGLVRGLDVVAGEFAGGATVRAAAAGDGHPHGVGALDPEGLGGELPMNSACSDNVGVRSGRRHPPPFSHAARRV